MDRRRRAARTVALMSLFTMADTLTDVPIASFVGDGSDLVSLSVDIEPIQDLHGYDSPWPAGGGKNLFDFDRMVGSAAIDTDPVLLQPGTYYVYVAGKNTAWNSFMQVSADGVTYINADTDSSVTTAYVNATMDYYRKKCILTVVAPVYCRLRLQINANVRNSRVAIMLTNDSTGYEAVPENFMYDNPAWAAIYEPYANICPISGWTGENIHVSPTTDAADGNTYSITFPTEAGTVYGGTLDVTTGKLTVDRANIASYNGETLTGRWISDRDVYSAGTTPTIGAQVVYELATPIVYDLTPTQVTTLIGTNNIWADTGDIKYIEYNI